MKNFFDIFGKDRDGFATEDEFISYFIRSENLLSTDKDDLKAYLRSFDKNKDGTLNVLEIIDSLKEIYEKKKIANGSISFIEKFIRIYEINLDGRVDEDEFVTTFIKLHK